jgi:hypothetical protein
MGSVLILGVGGTEVPPMLQLIIVLISAMPNGRRERAGLQFPCLMHRKLLDIRSQRSHARKLFKVQVLLRLKASALPEIY